MVPRYLRRISRSLSHQRRATRYFTRLELKFLRRFRHSFHI